MPENSRFAVGVSVLAASSAVIKLNVCFAVGVSVCAVLTAFIKVNVSFFSAQFKLSPLLSLTLFLTARLIFNARGHLKSNETI